MSNLTNDYSGRPKRPLLKQTNTEEEKKKKKKREKKREGLSFLELRALVKLV